MILGYQDGHEWRVLLTTESRKKLDALKLVKRYEDFRIKIEVNDSSGPRECDLEGYLDVVRRNN